ncbi:MAG: hypothetical protein RI947_1579 [Candidatus Parcubacteria bacterium]|jgi:RNA ligase partner protein
MKKFVLDTNLFFNMEAGLDLGTKTEEVVRVLTSSMKAYKKDGAGEFYTPPRVVEEFLSFFEDTSQQFIRDFLSQLIIKAPHVNDMQVAGAVIYQLVDEIRTRSYRGIGIAEEEINKAGKLVTGKPELSKKDFEMTIGPVVKNFRERYRQATRFGFIDSLADLDLIMLAKEVDGVLISADAGVIRWGRIFGVQEMPLDVFGGIMKEFA